MLKINNVKLAFGKHVVLDQINLAFQAGTIVGLVAPNGTGKSTLLNVILHNLEPQAGYVEYDHLRYRSNREIIKLHQLICAFPDQSDLVPFMSGRDHLKLYADLWGNSDKKVDEIINQLQMADYVDRPTHTYSLGMKQRLCFAMVVAADTPVMLLDEVMNGLDPQNVQLISNCLLKLKKENKLIIMASHLLNNLQSYADRVLFLKAGKVIEDLDNQHQTKQYLKTEANEQVEALLKDKKFTKLPDNKIILPLEDNDPELDQLVLQMTKQKIPYSIGRIDLTELFSKFYG
ncbi:ATP-binding cassette domain-containing protein [Lactobacillus helveticus]|uniref:ATP-binding cassette domain-containing protein n=1 Tax=Lactobacillus helveticus TaxID=1587 RepID=A0A6A7K0Q3_LACHE|nr:ABC transporter ATP-binding protein [Lactobacillus helveticus]MBN6049609.1 ABC transporter ATP-binding protein [Lactobacillus helveticus]MPW14150.1 ATP-binding cassette domain-containing protein [Lactobacillus helveticus]